MHITSVTHTSASRNFTPMYNINIHAHTFTFIAYDINIHLYACVVVLKSPRSDQEGILRHGLILESGFGREPFNTFSNNYLNIYNIIKSNTYSQYM